MIEIEIPTAPVAQARPRATLITHRGRYYKPGTRKIILFDPPAVKKFKQLVGYYVQQHYNGHPLTGPLSVTVRFYRDIQKSDSKKKKMAKEAGDIRPTKKPDVDNYVKSLLDALNKVLWADDNQIIDLHASKFYSAYPRIEIQVRQEDVGGD